MCPPNWARLLAWRLRQEQARPETDHPAWPGGGPPLAEAASHSGAAHAPSSNVHEAYIDPFERIEHAASEQTAEAAARATLHERLRQLIGLLQARHLVITPRAAAGG